MLVLNLKIVGRSQSSGRSLSTISSASRTSATATSKSTPHSNSSETIEILSLEVDEISFSWSTVVRLSSINLVTFSSMSAALAPA